MIGNNLYYVFQAYAISQKNSGKSGIGLVAYPRTSTGQLLNSFVKSYGVDALYRLCVDKCIRLHFYEYYGAVPLKGLPLISNELLNSHLLDKKLFRSYERIEPFIKSYLPSLDSNAIQLSKNIFYSKPNIFYGNKVICCFSSKYGINLDSSNTTVSDSLLHFRYEKDIFILPFGQKRHIPAKLLEEIYIDFKSGKVTAHCHDIIDGCYYETSEVYNPTTYSWEEYDVKKCKIVGFKKR